MVQLEPGPSLAQALFELNAGRAIGLPTETVYGLAADGTRPTAVAEIFRIKGRPPAHPLILHLAEASWLDQYCINVPSLAWHLAESLWPGPLTLVLERSSKVPDCVTGGLSTVAVRVPSHPVALSMLRAFARPLAAPSANRFGAVSPTTAQHVVDDLGEDVAVVLDGGACECGVESTIVEVREGQAKILRPGGITRETLEAMGVEVASGDLRASPRVPGSLESHYCPRARVQVVQDEDLEGAAHRAKGHGLKVGIVTQRSLRQSTDAEILQLGTSPEDLARGVYAAFRELDRRECAVIFLSLPTSDGLGAAVADRIRRAATRVNDGSD